MGMNRLIRHQDQIPLRNRVSQALACSTDLRLTNTSGDHVVRIQRFDVGTGSFCPVSND